MPNITLLIVALSSFCVITFLMLIVGFSNYKIAKREKFKMLSMFPYELQNSWGMPFTNYVRFLSTLSAICFSVFSINAFFKFDVEISKVLIATMIFSALLMMSLTFINMNIVKLHLTLDVLMFIMCFLNYGLFTVAILLGNTMYMKAWPGCVSGIIGIMYLISLFNPKLFRWMMLEKIEEKDGMSSVSRPKYFILPIYEWVTMGLNVLFLILVLVSWLFA